MQVYRYATAADWNAGAYTNAQLDASVNLSPYQHPAITPASHPTTWTPMTGAQAVGATQPPGAGLPTVTQSNTQGAGAAAWTSADIFALTAQAGDAVTFTTTALQVTIALAGILQAGMGAGAGGGLSVNQLRNGAVVNILVDSALIQAVDTYNAAPLVTLYLDGLSHTVQIAHSGGYNGAIVPVGPLTALVGTSMAAVATAAPVYHGSTVAATWRLLATGAALYSLYKTPQGGTESLVASGLATGTHYSSATYIPGVDLYVATSPVLTTNDSATFTTDVVQAAIERIQFGTGTGGGVSTYTSPVVDSGDPQQQWFLLEWAQATGLTGVTLATGNTPVPDGSWTTTALAPVSSTSVVPAVTPGATGLIGGVALGAASGMVAPRGRYAQWSVTFPGVSTVAPWIRDAALYAWIPERDPLILSKLGVAQSGWAAGTAALLPLAGTWNVHTTIERAAVQDQIASYSPGAALNEYLTGYLGDMVLPTYPAEPPGATQTRVQTGLRARGTGLSVPTIARLVAQYVTGQSPAPVVTIAAGLVTATCNGVTVQQLNTAPAYRVIIPPPPYANLAGLPVGSATTVNTAQWLISQYVTGPTRPTLGAPTLIFT